MKNKKSMEQENEWSDITLDYDCNRKLYFSVSQGIAVRNNAATRGAVSTSLPRLFVSRSNANKG